MGTTGNWFEPYANAFGKIGTVFKSAGDAAKNAIGTILSNEGKVEESSLQKYYNAEEGRITQSYNDAEKLYGDIFASTKADLDASKKTSEQQNYVNYRKIVEKYLPEYLNSSGLYDVGSMSQPFLNAENNYISSAGAIQQNYDSNMRAAQNDYSLNMYNALTAKNNALSELERYKIGIEREDESQAKEEERLEQSQNEEKAAAKADELINYIVIGAGEYSGAYDYDALDNFETNYKEDLTYLQKNYPDYYSRVINYLNSVKNSSDYINSKEAETELKAEEERIKTLQDSVTNMTNEGFEIKEVKGTSNSNEVKITDSDKHVYTVEINREENSDDIKNAASNLADGTLFRFKDGLYIKHGEKVYSLKESYWDHLKDDYNILAGKTTREAVEAAKEAEAEATAAQQAEDPMVAYYRQKYAGLIN